MQQLKTRFAPHHSGSAIALACLLAFSLAACGKKGDASGAVASNGDAVAAKTGKISACALMPKEEVNSITGSSYSVVDGKDERGSSSCHYSSDTDPAGMSVSLQWVLPSDYSNPAEHLALQKAAMGGAKLGGKLTESIGGSGNPLHLPSGPIADLGDEANANMLLLTARKGDYTLMVQMMPTDMMALATDSTAGTALGEKEKAIARKVLAKL